MPFDQWLPNTKPRATTEGGADFATGNRLARVNMKDGVPQPTQRIRALLAGAAGKIFAYIHDIHLETTVGIHFPSFAPSRRAGRGN
jgi:hypothetical protein